MTPAVLNVAEQLFSGQTAWTGPDDCSGQFYLMWDDVNIYIAVVVKDEKLSMNKTDGNIWNADCVEVFFSTTNAVAGHAEHYQYGFNANNQKWNWCNIDGAGNRVPDYLQIASSSTAGGYICEVSIPYGQMPSLNFSVGNTIGFHPVLDETDDGDRELQMTWTGREAHDQSLGFGHIVLSDEPATPGPVPVDPGAEGLVAYYALDTDANDSSGNGFNGTLFGDPEFVEGPPGYGMAMYFDGDDYVDTGNAQDLPYWTISAWVKSPAAPAAASASGPVHREKNFQFNWNHTSATFSGAAAFRVGGTWHAAKYEPVQADTWYHLTATYDGEDLKAYRDGVLITTNSAPSGPPDAETGTLKLGRHATSATQYFTGTVDEAVIYSRALSYGEVRYLAGVRSGAPENLVLNPSFEEDEAILDDPDWERWCTWNPAEGAGSNAAIVDTQAIDGLRSLRIEPKGIENWHFIVLYLPILVDINKNYTVSFWAKAESPRPLTVQLKATDNSINAWGATDFQLTTEWVEYHYVSNVLIDNVKLEILCSGTEVPFWLDLVSVSEGN
jgi:hypothetical protein